MRVWGGRLVVLAALAAVGILAWLYFFPSPERAIRKRLAEVARTCSVSANEGPMAKLQNCQKLASFCAEDVEVAIDAYGQRGTCNGRNELFQTLRLAIRQSQLSGSVSVEFLDPVITLLPDKETAVCKPDHQGQDPERARHDGAGMQIHAQKDVRSWLIRKVETVKTLSTCPRSMPQDRRRLCRRPAAA